jgi:lysine/ornithine N-monooxygenase
MLAQSSHHRILRSQIRTLYNLINLNKTNQIFQKFYQSANLTHKNPISS